jgi:hypothetical protein
VRGHKTTCWSCWLQSSVRTVALQTPVLERHLDYYRRVVGHAVVDQTRSQAVLAKKIGEVAVILKSGDVFRCEGLSFEIGTSQSIAAVAKLLLKEGPPRHLVQSKRVSASGRHNSRVKIDDS